MREWNVRILSETYKLFASDRYHAASVGVRMYLKTHPGHTFTQLMNIVSARLVHPEVPGRKPFLYVGASNV